MLTRIFLVICAGFCLPALGVVSGSELVDLRCEYFQSPLNVDVPHPRLSWIFTAPQHGAAQTAYQVLVASTAPLLAGDQGDLWDSGKTVSSASIQIVYSGKTLAAGEQCFWKVRIWDEADHPTPWSQPASWSMGKLIPTDWTAKWIGAANDAATDSAADSSNLGYHAAVTDQADDLKWVQVDLGKSVPIDLVKLHSLNHEVPGFGFPIRFTITASDDPAFSTASTIVDQSSSDYPNPGATAVSFKANHLKGRYVRVTASRLLRRSQGDHSCCFALAELQVFCGSDNVALHAPVTAKDSVEGYGWGESELTDGLGLVPDKTSTTPGSVITTLPIFRKQFLIKKPVSRAALSICGLGQYELHLNGQKVGDSLLEPGWTDYRKTCLYQTYDLTGQLRPGSNVVGVMLGNGMYHVASTPGRYTKFSSSIGPPKVIGQLDITYSDGTTETIATDNSWNVTGGPITFSSTYGGEDYDARLEPPSWDSSNGNNRGWQPATETTGPGGKLTGSSQSAPSITVASILTARKITRPTAGAWVYDLGQNCSMMPEITVTGPAGAVVRMMPGEVLNRDGTVSQQPSGGPAYFSYTLKGGSSAETWAPRFTYYGSRYIQVSGAVPAGSPNPDHLPVVSELRGLFVTSSSPSAGEFSCSNQMFNQTANLIRWAMRNNMMSILTDCPHREKLGWLEQVHLVGPSLMYNFEIPSLFTKMCADIADAQTENGLVPDIAPEYPVFSGGFRDSPEWGSAAVLIPWQVYQWYGDTQILARHYETMQRYVAYLGTTAKDNIISHGLGDWYDLGPNPPGYAQLTPIPLTATAFYYRDITILQQSAKLLGHGGDAKTYEELAAKVRDSFNNSLYHSDAHSYATGSQTANAIPLVMGLAPESDRPVIMDNIVKDIRTHHDGLTAGDIGYRYLLRALADGGRSDVIFDMNSRSDRPGYGMMISRGATSLTEAWDARVDSSQDHFMLGHIMEWFYSDLAGIQPDPSGAGFKKIMIKPTPVGDVTWAKASYMSVRGMIRSSWNIHGNTFSLEVEIPPGCTADVELPKRYNSAITEEGQPLANIEVISGKPEASASPIVTVSSGTYHFKSRAK
jgi:hypothetical protein